MALTTIVTAKRDLRSKCTTRAATTGETNEQKSKPTLLTIVGMLAIHLNKPDIRPVTWRRRMILNVSCLKA